MICKDITLGNITVGEAKVESTGLYYHIRCRCQFRKKGIYKIHVSGERGTANLGTCVPEGEWYILEKKIPRKLLGESNFNFAVRPDYTVCHDFLPVSESEPFSYIDRLRECRMVKQNGGVGLVFTVQGSTLQDNDQSPICQHKSVRL